MPERLAPAKHTKTKLNGTAWWCISLQDLSQHTPPSGSLRKNQALVDPAKFTAAVHDDDWQTLAIQLGPSKTHVKPSIPPPLPPESLTRNHRKAHLLPEALEESRHGSPPVIIRGFHAKGSQDSDSGHAWSWEGRDTT